MLPKKTGAFALLFCLLLCTCLTQGHAARLEDPDRAPYIEALEEALTAEHGETDTWSLPLRAAFAAAKYFSGVDPSYVPAVPPSLGALSGLEASAITPAGPGSFLAVERYLQALDDALNEEKHAAMSWSYAERALLAALEYYAGVSPAYRYGTAILPEEDDLPQQEAIDLARRAVAERYGLTEAEILAFDVYTIFIPPQQYMPERHWYVVIGLNDEGYEKYLAVITSPEGEVVRAEENLGHG